MGVNGIFTSTLLANTTPYTFYRIVITSVNGGNAVQIGEIEMTESTSTAVGNVNGGGTFVLSTPNTTVSVNGLSALASLITANATSGTNILNITSGIVGITSVSNLINHSGACNLTITTPSVTGAQGQNGGNCIVKSGLGILTVGNSTIPTTIRGGASNGGGTNNGISSSNGDIVIVGTVLGPPSVNANNCHGITQTNGKLTIVGDVTGGTLSGNAISSSSPLALEITGNVTGGSGLAAINKTAGAIIITGNVEARNLQAIIGTPASMLITGNVGSFPVASGLVSAIAITNTATIEVNGFVAANSTSVAITALSNSFFSKKGVIL